MEKYYLLTFLRNSKFYNVANSYEHHCTKNIEERLMYLWKLYPQENFYLINILEVSKEFYEKYEGGM